MFSESVSFKLNFLYSICTLRHKSCKSFNIPLRCVQRSWSLTHSTPQRKMRQASSHVNCVKLRRMVEDLRYLNSFSQWMNHIDCSLTEFHVAANISRYTISNFVMKGLLVTIAAVAAFASLFNCAYCAPIPTSGGNVLDGTPEEKKLVSDIEFHWVILRDFCTATNNVFLTSNRDGLASLPRPCIQLVSYLKISCRDVRIRINSMVVLHTFPKRFGQTTWRLCQ